HAAQTCCARGPSTDRWTIEDRSLALRATARQSVHTVAGRRRRSLAKQSSHATPPAENQRSGGTCMNILLLASGGDEHWRVSRVAATQHEVWLLCALADH